MKKITRILIMLLSITAFSQVEIVENFDSTTNNQVPPGWTGVSLGARTNFACGGSGKAIYSGLDAGTSSSLTTQNYASISNGTDLTASFSYNIFEQASMFFPISYTPPATNWGSLVLEYSTNGGGSWTTITTIDDSNYTFGETNTCQVTTTIPVGTIANGSDFQARFVTNAVNVNGYRLVVLIDDVTFLQVATEEPNCDATLLNPLNASTTADTNVTLSWQTATGLPTGYTVSVGTTSGGTDILNAVQTTATNYSLEGAGLLYETEYFVSIVPFNGIGSATGCTEESFTTRVTPVDGATCSKPHTVSSFPYIISSDDTANYENNVNTGSCGSSDTSYMNGNDVFYEITPANDVSINIDLTNINNNGAGMHLMKGCPTDVDKECVDFTGSYSTSGGSLNISEAVLFAGNTYFLVLSNSSSSRTYAYSLIITENSCINPSFTLSTVTDCGNEQFSVNVDVSYLGSATSLELTDNFGNINNNITSTGIVNMGPYPSGSTVDFTLTNNQDSSCSYTDSTYFYCPPVNDECSSAIALDVNTDDTCDLFTSASNAGATDSVGDPTVCSGNTNDVWFSFVANESAVILEFSNVVSAPGTPAGALIQSVELLEGSCGSLTSLECTTAGVSGYVEFHNLTDGNTYYIRNKSNTSGAYAQNYDICLKTPPSAPVNDECSNATTLNASTDDQCNNQVSGTTSGASLSAESTCGTGYKDVWYTFTPTTTGIYEFSLTYTGSTTTRYFIYEGTCGALIEKSTTCSTNSNQIFSLNSGQSYSIMVRTAQTGPGVDFNLCVWQLPPAVANSDCSTPATLMESSDLNGNNTISGNLDNAYNSPEGCSSSSYESVWYSFTPQYTGTYNFDFTKVSGNAYYSIFNTDTCANVSNDYVAGSCYSSSDLSGDVVAGNTYLICVHSSSAAEFELFAYPEPSLSVESNTFEAFKYYPNPVVNTLTVTSGNNNTISNVRVFNMLGQQIQTLTPNNTKALIDMNALTNGVYFVKIDINGSQKTIKVIKK
ncbi:MAG: T9SS type A sorting domain-containing protein [Flavobacteriaceae bacterium]